MKDTALPLDEWKQLYELASQVKQLAPWEWMEESDLFGVQQPGTGRQGFVSVMGMLGEHFAVSVYLGTEGLYRFWEFEEAGPFCSPERILEIPQIQVSFGSRDDLEKPDRELIKSLGLRFRGRTAWPLFRSYQPGFAPWFLEADEARFTAVSLRQLLDVAPRFQTDPFLLEPRLNDVCLFRVPTDDGDAAWEDRRMAVPPPEPEERPAPPAPELLGRLENLPQRGFEVEIDLILLPAPIGEKGERPHFPYLLLVVEVGQGMILGTDALEPLPSLVAMRGKAVEKLAETYAQMEALPAKITVSDGRLFDAVKPLATALGIVLNEAAALPAVEAAKESFYEYAGLG